MRRRLEPSIEAGIRLTDRNSNEQDEQEETRRTIWKLKWIRYKKSNHENEGVTTRATFRCQIEIDFEDTVLCFHRGGLMKED